MSDDASILSLRFAAANPFPNNPVLPVLVYRQVAQAAGCTSAEEIAEWFERTWPKHHWYAAWRYGVYNFPHYHSTAHEVLGAYRGQASLRLGDRAGIAVTVNPGDVLILPAGTAHENLGASADFHVVGGYPNGQEADLVRGEPEKFAAAIKRIAKVPVPTADPIFGMKGPLTKHWREAKTSEARA